MVKSVILIPSTRMDGNQKQDRDENSLIRMAKVARENLDPQDHGLTLSGKKSVELTPFMAFSKDIDHARKLIAEGQFAEKDLPRIGFVSSKTFEQLGGKKDFYKCKLGAEGFEKLLIGTDPELLFMQEGNIKHANNVMGFGGAYKFGSDGPMAELRPDPADTPEGLVANMRSILADGTITGPINDLDWMSACYYETAQRDYPVGTHIHIDNPKKIADLDGGENQHRINNSPRHRLFAVTNKILDELLTLPMIRLDGSDGHKRRARCKMSATNGYNRNAYGKGYGFLGEWRPANGRLEFRSLSGLPLMDPDICTTVFGTAKAIAEAVYREALRQKLKGEYILPAKFSSTSIYQKDFKNWDDIPLAAAFECVAPSNDVAALMDESSRSKVSPKFIKIWLARMRKLPTYKQYEDHIEGLGDVLSCSAGVLDGFSRNMKQAWKE